MHPPWRTDASARPEASARYRPVVGGDADIAAVATLLADPGRARVLLALADGRALPAGTLAAEAGVAASTASEHLARLVAGGLLSVESHGRHRYYRLTGPHVAQVLETLAALAPAQPIRSLRDDTRARRLRRARTCYDHLAGRLGVAVMASMIRAGHLTGGDGTFDPSRAVHDRLSAPGRGDVDYRLTERGHGFLRELGVELAPRRRPVRYCVDWTEQRHHLAGAVGHGLLERFVALDWIRRAPGDRAVTVTPAGAAGLADRLGLDWPGDPAQAEATTVHGVTRTAVTRPAVT
jgi:DNA-binding transcriptional ArsR family regulator